MDAEGRLVDKVSDDDGVLAVPPGGFGGAVATLRSRFPPRPMLLAGMIGSSRGWVNVPYVPCPAGIDGLAAAIHWVEDDELGIVPGVSYETPTDADVMRGEEVQIFGIDTASLASNPPICHPGTHAKWVRLDAERITAFRTVMTGELFSLLKEHSILAEMLTGRVRVGSAFAAGVAKGLKGEMIEAELFSIRAKLLLNRADPQDAASFASGLLIGGDVRTGLAFVGPGDVLVVGQPSLTTLYAAALAECRRNAREIDGEDAFLAGMKRIVERIS